MKDLFLLIHGIIIKMEIIQNMMKIWNSSINTFSKSLLNIKLNTNIILIMPHDYKYSSLL